MVCNTQASLGALGRLGCFSPDETLGLQFTAKAQYCTGGWVYTGSGTGWSGVTAYLFRVSDQKLLIQQSVSTGTGNAVFPFIWTAPQPLQIGADYIIAINKLSTSCYAGTLSAPLPADDGFAAARAFLFSTGFPVFPTQSTGSNVGIYPQICTQAQGFCSFGTQPTSSAQLLYYLTPGLIDTWLTALGMIWLAPIFTAVYFTTINVNTLCSSGPPDISFVTATSPADFSSLQILQLVQAIAWSQLCTCTPGSPQPTPFPPPSIKQPTGWAAAPSTNCSNSDTCSMLQQLFRILGGLTQSVASIREEVDLLQRYSLPFAYVTGAQHSGLTGDGSFAISRLVGVKLTVTARPVTFVASGNPPYIYNLGWIALETSDGLIRERRIAQDIAIWTPDDCQLATLLAFHCNAGVSLTITELQAEP